jgi:hypothetical protein
MDVMKDWPLLSNQTQCKILNIIKNLNTMVCSNLETCHVKFVELVFRQHRMLQPLYKHLQMKIKLLLQTIPTS